MNVLIIRFSSLGDVILTTGPIKLLKETYPTLKIDILTYKPYDLLFVNNPHVNNVISIERNMSLLAYINFLKNVIKNYSYVIDLQGNFKSSIAILFKKKHYALYKKYTIKRRLFAKYRLFSSSLKSHITERYLYGIKKFFHVSSNTLEELRPVIYNKKNIEGGDTVVINPFASKKTKEWPYFIELTKKLLNKGIRVIVIGNGYFPEMDNLINITNKTDINHLIEVISQARLLITTDSGPMHIGIALKKNIIAIFGSTTKEFGFYPIFENCYVFEKNNLVCRPCHIHGRNKCSKKHFKCMKDISIDEVFKKTMEFLEVKKYP